MPSTLLLGMRYVSGAASRCKGPAIRCPGFEVGIPQGDYNLSLRQKADIDLPDPYDRDETWLKMPAGKGKLGSTSAIDIDVDGNGAVTATRLYQLVRQSGDVTTRNFEIRFLDSGVQAYAFTFG